MLIPPLLLCSTLTVAISQTTYQPIGGENLGKPVQIPHCSWRRGGLLSFRGVVSRARCLAYVRCAGLHHRLPCGGKGRKAEQRSGTLWDREKSRDLFCGRCGAAGRYG